MPASYSELYSLVAEITNWAKAKGIMGDARVEPDYDEALIRGTFPAGLHSATTALQDRHISYIGLNEANSSVVIYVEKTLRKADRDALVSAGHGNCAIEFYHAGMQTSGGPPAASGSIPPYYQHNGFYTCGSSVSVANEATAGTLGCLLQNKSGEVFALSNNHVFAGNNYCEIGIQIIAPGQSDIRANALDPFTLGHLYKAVPLADGNPEIVDASKNVDAAVIRIADTSKISSMQRQYYDSPSQVVQIQSNMVVEKVGRTTGKTTGIVNSFHPSPFPVRCLISKLGSHKIVYFQDFWGVLSQAGAFSMPGDSGSLVSTTDSSGNRVGVGLVFAGDTNLSLIIPLSEVLSYFDLSLVNGLNT